MPEKFCHFADGAHGFNYCGALTARVFLSWLSYVSEFLISLHEENFPPSPLSEIDGILPR
ncbi:MAG: hypothetical protein ABIS50_25240 [Luteolibacter sp.]|uniref:hypothetical protein n=1 Tax=Luteolibacter sp. TaxID=1962973 RepID=UPI0032653AB9